ncbi:unnamed protein product [Arabis nemorensis]|uniref:Clp R domain-containing protein n=1 Tax=Arabis nemorensis TaxID=586526 RepID=A0A565BN25_9BRAS|nr:unnamed protein product [Arabis nemorensis]
MRGGGCSVQSALTPEAGNMVKQAMALARQRGHAQGTPLHVSSTMLSAPTCLLRTASLQSHTHPFQCRALELCFNVEDFSWLVELSTANGGPLILSEAWLAVHGPRNLHMGSTWEWQSRNYSSDVSDEEASRALHELLPKSSVVYPNIEKWDFAEARAGLRAMPMPPVTSHGSLPLLGCIDQLVGAASESSKFWFFGGLGSCLDYSIMLGLGNS